MPEPIARRLFQPVEPVALVTYMADEPTEAVMALDLHRQATRRGPASLAVVDGDAANLAEALAGAAELRVENARLRR